MIKGPMFLIYRKKTKFSWVCFRELWIAKDCLWLHYYAYNNIKAVLICLFKCYHLEPFADPTMVRVAYAGNFQWGCAVESQVLRLEDLVIGFLRQGS